MVDPRMHADPRPESPTTSTKTQLSPRRKSSSKSDNDISGITTSQLPEVRPQTPTNNAQLSGLTTATASPAPGSAPVQATPVTSSPAEAPRRQPRQHVHGEDVGGPVDDTSLEEHATLHDIRQSRWIEDPDNAASEKVYLTSEAGPLSQMSTIQTDFAWVHLHRGTDMRFEAFVLFTSRSNGTYGDLLNLLLTENLTIKVAYNLQDTVDDVPGLFKHEHSVARKCLEEVQHMRSGFANGKYFDPIVHQVKEGVELAGERTEVKATFVSIPVFSSMRFLETNSMNEENNHHHHTRLRQSFQPIYERIHRHVHEDKYTRHHDREISRRQLQKRDSHPIRSLMQYTNILAGDNERDMLQAIVRLKDDDDHHPSVIHVPEFWALIINNYTIVTCAPFTAQQLNGKNIIHLKPQEKDLRVFVKYTNLHGGLHEFRCRTWIGLLNTIATIEQQIAKDDELSVQLQREQSPYKLVDSKFRSLDRKGWQIVTTNKAASKIHVRLFKIADGDRLDTAYSTRKFWRSRGNSWELMGYQVASEAPRVRLQDIKNKLKTMSAKERSTFDYVEVQKLQDELENLRQKAATVKRDIMAQRFLYAAVRYHLIDPQGLLFDDDQTYQDAIRNRRIPPRANSGLSNASTEGSKPSHPEQASDSAPKHQSHSSSPPLSSKVNQSLPNGLSTDIPANQNSRASSRIPSPTALRSPHHSPRPRGRLNAHLDAMPPKAVDGMNAGSSQVLDRFEFPPRRDPATVQRSSSPKKDSSRPRPSSLIVPHQPVRRISTFSEIRNMPTTVEQQGPHSALPRAKTSHDMEMQDIERQKFNRRRNRNVRFSERSLTERSGPVSGFAIQKSNATLKGNRQERPLPARVIEIMVPEPAIFRPRAPIAPVTKSGPVAIAPHRLPPIIGETEFIPLHVLRSQLKTQLLTRQSSAFEFPKTQQNLSENETVEPSAHVASSDDPARLSCGPLGKKRKDLKEVQPFFEWAPEHLTMPATPLEPKHSDAAFKARENFAAQNWPSNSASKASTRSREHARDLLQILYFDMTMGHFVAEDFAVQPEDFARVKPTSFDQVVATVHYATGNRLRTVSRNDEERMTELRAEIILSVDTIIRCFIGNDNQDAELIGKIWGIVDAIVRVPVEDLRAATRKVIHLKPNVLSWIQRAMVQIEQDCQDILLSARSDTGNIVEQLDLPLPPVFITQFRNIVLFILSANLLLKETSTENNVAAAESLLDTIKHSWTDCETALLREAREFKENGDNGEYMQESIKTADTLLGLLLQNAFSISCSEGHEDDDNSPYCDLEDIYRQWTRTCQKKAVREASAEMYGEVRHLREEFVAILSVLEGQRAVHEKILKVRETPDHTLDMRISKRTRTHLNDMIKRFSTLKDYAQEAETLTTNSIEVSNEDNSKAIYVFTVVTLIFLPLNFVSSVLGMNTSDIRGMSRSSSLFWEISVPVMIVVLTTCFVLVKWKFKYRLRRKVGKYCLKLFPKDWKTKEMEMKETKTRVVKKAATKP